jgi:hypothetical protein
MTCLFLFEYMAKSAVLCTQATLNVQCIDQQGSKSLNGFHRILYVYSHHPIFITFCMHTQIIQFLSHFVCILTSSSLHCILYAHSNHPISITFSMHTEIIQFSLHFVCLLRYRKLRLTAVWGSAALTTPHPSIRKSWH